MCPSPMSITHSCASIFLSLFLAGTARRSIRIEDSHHDAQQRSGALLNGLEFSAESRQAWRPSAFSEGKAGRSNAAHEQGLQWRAPHARPGSARLAAPAAWPPLGLRRVAVAALHDASGPKEEEKELSAKELLSLPVPKLISELASLEKKLVLDASGSAKVIDKVCEYASTTFDPDTRAVSEDIELQKKLLATYESLRDRGVLRGFGSCAGALVPLRKDNFSPEDQERATGIPTTAFAPPRFLGLPELGLGAFAAFGLIYGEAALGLDARTVGGAFLAAIVLDNVAFRGSIGETIARTVRPGYREIVLQHEAGHLLVAYLLGNPIQACLLDSWSALKDGRFYGVQAGTVFFDPVLGESMLSGKLTRTCLDRYTIIVMAGIAAEAMARGQAEGGRADEEALIRLLASLDGGRTWNLEKIQFQARWGVAQAFLLLRDHESAYKALCKALERGGSIGEAIMAIEGALAQEPELPAEARKRSQQVLGVGMRRTPAKRDDEELKATTSEPPKSIEEVEKIIREKEAQLAQTSARLTQKEAELAREVSDEEGSNS